ncbi:hypothetical protein PM082_008782 [Marasmius tenuissimus]|nr:hypothetical protein PM082_008782 [Marasmius tenuissimus]
MPVLTSSTAPPPPLPTKSNGLVPQQNSRSAIPLQAEGEEDSPKPRIPTVRLDAPIVTDSIAARLATTLLNHVLFLKSQVPLPVMILHKQRQTNVKADKPRLELLNTLDILSSHLDTTFTALSTAYARIPKPTPTSTRPTYLAILIGPSISTARAKVVFGVDGLEEKIWGMRDDDDDDDEDESEDDDEEEEEDSDVEEDAESSEEEGDGPPDSDTDEDDDEEEGVPQASSEQEQSPSLTQPEPAKPRPQQVNAKPQPQTYAELQALLHKADRLFSNTLARAEGEGRGMSSELAPTKTHILIRAPRRFTHPAWVPRQNMERTMERVVSEFEEGREVQPQRKGKSEKNKVEGVWITSNSPPNVPTGEIEGNTTQDEQDEMIWWSWEGELVGYN